MALGAPRRHVLGLMLKMGGRLVLIGLAIGTAVSLGGDTHAPQSALWRAANRSRVVRGRGSSAVSCRARHLLSTGTARRKRRSNRRLTTGMNSESWITNPESLNR